jgi:serine/threonine protein kinase
MVRPDGSVKITDFGIAWSARSVALTRTGQVIGTPAVPLARAGEGKHATPASDVYALGLIGYECLVGHPAFEGDNAVTIALKQVQQEPEPAAGTLPEEVRDLICRALHKDPAARYADGGAFVEAIEAVLEGRPLPEAPKTVSVARMAAPAPSRASGSRTTGPRTVPPGAPRTDPHALRRPGARPPPARSARDGPAAAARAARRGGIAAALFQALAGDSPGSPAEAADLQQQTGTTVTIRPRTTSAARSRRSSTSSPHSASTSSAARCRPTTSCPDTVTGVDPDGVLEPEDRVVVSYAVRPGTGGTSDGGAGVTGTAVDPAGGTSEAATPTGEAGATDPGTGTDGSELPGEPWRPTWSTPTTHRTHDGPPRRPRLHRAVHRAVHRDVHLDADRVVDGDVGDRHHLSEAGLKPGPPLPGDRPSRPTCGRPRRCDAGRPHGVGGGGDVTGSTRRVLGGRYRLDSLLATGGMGQVWRACDVLLDRPVAVKVLRSEYSGDPTFLSRFRAEAHHSAGLVHRNIATLFDYGESAAPDETSEDLAYLVMELVEGEPLSALLAAGAGSTPSAPSRSSGRPRVPWPWRTPPGWCTAT